MYGHSGVRVWWKVLQFLYTLTQTITKNNSLRAIFRSPGYNLGPLNETDVVFRKLRVIFAIFNSFQTNFICEQLSFCQRVVSTTAFGFAATCAKNCATMVVCTLY